MDDPIAVRLKVTGGFAGNLPPLDIATSDLSAAEAQEVSALLGDVDLARLDRRLSSRSTATPDARTYDLEVATGEYRHRFLMGDRQVPAELRPLISRLTQMARRQRGGGR